MTVHRRVKHGIGLGAILAALAAALPIYHDIAAWVGWAARIEDRVAFIETRPTPSGPFLPDPRTDDLLKRVEDLEAMFPLVPDPRVEGLQEALRSDAADLDQRIDTLERQVAVADEKLKELKRTKKDR